MVRTIRGIDTDNYDGIIPVSHFQRLYDAYDVRFNIIGLEAGMPYSGSQWANSKAAGLFVPFGYKFLYWLPDDLERMKRAAGLGLPVAIDVEYGEGMAAGVGATVDRILRARDVLRAEGLYWGPYSSRSEWQRLTGGTMALAGDRGWAAGYPFGGGVVPPVSFLPDVANFTGFGGLKILYAQYADACWEDGPWHLDLNATEVAPEDKEMALLVCCKPDERGGAPFRSYVLSGTGDGNSCHHVGSAQEHDALVEYFRLSQLAAGNANPSPLVEVPLSTLREFGAAPDPAAP